jgi:hypothetical protein
MIIFKISRTKIFLEGYKIMKKMISTTEIIAAITAVVLLVGIGGCGGQHKCTSQEKGFTPLFNGRDLTGWEGDTKSYVARDGMVVVDPNASAKGPMAGFLFTNKEYSDFVLSLEYKLTPGANNGVGIRVPLPCPGNPSYQGMEIQVLDDGDEIYQNPQNPRYLHLKDYQYNGSVYGVVPAKRGYLKPAGQWNCEEIIANGSRIRVILNGSTIVDADLDKVKLLDGEGHPGIKRQKGRIGFLGHGDKLQYRNIKIKELKKS